MTPRLATIARYALFGLVLLSAPLVAYHARRAVESNSNRVEDWLPESFEETQQLRWFGEHFGADDLLMMSWEGCRWDDPRLAILADELRKPLVLDGRERQLFRYVVTVGDVVEGMMQPPLDLTLAQTKTRLRGWLLGKDGETGSVVATLTRDGWDYRHQMIEHIKSCLLQLDGVTPETMHIAGQTLDSVAIDQASNHRLVETTVVSFMVGFVLLLVLLRSWYLASIIFIDAVYCQQLSLALVDWTGAQMDSVLMLVPVLIYVLTISAGVHIANYYLDAAMEVDLEDAPRVAMRAALSPCSLATATTVLGFLSLLVTFLTPVHKFGVFASASLALSTLTLFVLLPAQLREFPPRRLVARLRLQDRELLSPAWSRFAQFVIRWPVAILIPSLAVLAIGIYGVTTLKAGAHLHDLFFPSSRIVRDYDWLEERIGPLIPVEVVLRMPKDTTTGEDETFGLLEKLQFVGRVHQSVANVEGIGAAVSALNFCPPLPNDATSVRQTIRRSILDEQLESSREQFIQIGLFRETESEELWRISARAYAGEKVDYGSVLQQLRSAINEVLNSETSGPLAAVQPIVCGGVPLVQKAQEQMLEDLITSFAVALGMITLMMMGLLIGSSASEIRQAGFAEGTKLVLQRCAAGALSMVPNLFPCVVVLGTMGLFGISLEIGSIMTASVAIGIAVDDTLHYLTWFRRGLRRGLPRPKAVRFAYWHCGNAMLQTSLICGLGLLVFAVSPFVPMARFGWLIFAMLGTALVADLIVFPALLMTPLGRFFEPSKVRSAAQARTWFPEPERSKP